MQFALPMDAPEVPRGSRQGPEAPEGSGSLYVPLAGSAESHQSSRVQQGPTTTIMNKDALDQLKSSWTPPAEFPQTLPLDRVGLQPDVFQVKEFKDDAGVSEGKYHVHDLVQVLRGDPKVDLDPIDVLPVGDRYIIIDGHHRYAAYRETGRKIIPVRVFEGSPREALLHAGDRNRRVHRDLTPNERSQRAWELTLSGEGFKQRDIVQGSGVSIRSVKSMSAVLKWLNQHSTEPPEKWLDALALYTGKATKSFNRMEKENEMKERLSKALGPSKRFKTSSSKQILADALVSWGPKTSYHVALHILEFHIGTDELKDYLVGVIEEREEEEEDSEF